MTVPTSRFADATSIAAVGEGRYAVEVDSGWTVGGFPNGGYLLAVLGRAAVAAVAAVGQPHPLAASAHYLRPPTPGPAEIRAEVLRAGRTASQVHVRLIQDDVICTDAIVTAGVIAGDAEVHWSRLPAPELPGFDDCVRLEPATPTGFPVAIMDQVDARLDPAVMGFSRGAPSGNGELRGWLTLLDDESIDVFTLLYAVDAFPPASFEIAVTGWVPTLELTTYLRAVPAPGPLRVVQRAQLIADGRLDEVCLVWDSTGRLVAQATQLAGLRLG